MKIRYLRSALPVVLGFLCFLGCERTNNRNTAPKPSLLLLNSRQSSASASEILKKAVLQAENPSLLLKARLQDLINPEIRVLILQDLLPAFEKRTELAQILAEHYAQNPPRQCPDEVLHALMNGPVSLVTPLVEIYLQSGLSKDMDKVELRLKGLETPEWLNLLQMAEICIRQQRFFDAARILVKLPVSENQGLQARVLYAEGRLEFLQQNHAGCVEKLKELLVIEKYRDLVLEPLIDSCILLNDSKAAFRYIQVFASQRVEDFAITHTLRGKLHILNRNHQQARREWLLARDLKATGRQWNFFSFLLSHYHTKMISGAEMGEFILWKGGRLARTDLLQNSIFVAQYARLVRHDPQVLARVQDFYPSLHLAKSQ